MKYVFTALNWIFGVLFLLIGLIFFFASTFEGIIFIIVALLLIPPVRNFAYSKTNKEIPVKARAILIFVLLIAPFISIAQREAKFQKKVAQEAQVQAEKQAAIDRERQKTIDYFNANSDKILSDARAYLNRGEYKEVISLSSKYSVAENKELTELNSKAQAEMAAIKKAKKEAQEKAQAEMAAVEKAKKEAQEKAQAEMAAIEKAKKEAQEKAENDIKTEKAKRAAVEKQELLKKALGLSWNYNESQDKMGRGTIKTASIHSINTVNFEFPYQGEQRATLQLRVHPKHGKDVIFGIEQGQFQCGFNGCSITVRFDEGKPQNFRAAQPADNDTTTLFIKNYPSFYSAAKKSKKIYIEATFYQQGTRVFEFDSADLKF